MLRSQRQGAWPIHRAYGIDRAMARRNAIANCRVMNSTGFDTAARRDGSAGAAYSSLNSSRRRSGCSATLAVLLAIATSVSGCTYLRFSSVQGAIEARNAANPELRLSKHLLGTPTYFVYGRLLSQEGVVGSAPLAVAALSNRFRRNEIVEVASFSKSGSYFGMNLPDGQYRLQVYLDGNRDGLWDKPELVGQRDLTLSKAAFPEHVAGGIDIDVAPPDPTQGGAIEHPIRVPTSSEPTASLFYPKGTIRTLDDPLYSPAMSKLGMYAPAAFMETAPMMFYAAEEYSGYKIPVVFVHGLNGTPRDFRALVDGLDRTRYQAWFFFYPSGMNLRQVAKLFYKIVLSGEVVPGNGSPLVLVAHSMGGLMVREALNDLGTGRVETPIGAFISIASPFGGEPSAATGVRHAPMVVPSWRDLDPSSEFIGQLFRRPLPAGIARDLNFSTRGSVDPPHGSDGVVPVTSQLAPAARAEAQRIRGFKAEHTQVLGNRAAIDAVLQTIHSVKGLFPEEQLRYLAAGGFDVPLGESYTELERHLLKTNGVFWRALAQGRLTAIHPIQVHFQQVVAGAAEAVNPIEFGWLKFAKEYPALARELATP